MKINLVTKNPNKAKEFRLILGPEINVKQISEVVSKLCMEANFDLPEDVLEALKKATSKEESPLGIEILNQLTENVKLAAEKRLPICQDTGYNVVFLELGQEVRITGGDLYQAINEGIRRGSKEGYLRCSILNDSLDRKNTGDNTLSKRSIVF